MHLVMERVYTGKGRLMHEAAPQVTTRATRQKRAVSESMQACGKWHATYLYLGTTVLDASHTPCGCSPTRDETDTGFMMNHGKVPNG